MRIFSKRATSILLKDEPKGIFKIGETIEKEGKGASHIISKNYAERKRSTYGIKASQGLPSEHDSYDGELEDVVNMALTGGELRPGSPTDLSVPFRDSLLRPQEPGV